MSPSETLVGERQMARCWGEPALHVPCTFEGANVAICRELNFSPFGFPSRRSRVRGPSFAFQPVAARVCQTYANPRSYGRFGRFAAEVRRSSNLPANASECRWFRAALHVRYTFALHGRGEHTFSRRYRSLLKRVREYLHQPPRYGIDADRCERCGELLLNPEKHGRGRCPDRREGRTA